MPTTSEQAPSKSSLLIRSSRAADQSALHELVATAGVFSSEEVVCARELIDESLAQKQPASDEDYQLLIAELPEDGRIVGYVCYGRVPFTVASWDLYWLATHPEARRRGVARTLVAAMEQAIRERGGINVRVETSSTEGYGAARSFYDGIGYTLMARLPDFYKPGDDLFSFFKRL